MPLTDINQPPEISQRSTDNRTPTVNITDRLEQIASLLEENYHALQRGQRHLIPRYLKNMYQYQANGISVALQYQSQMVIRITGLIIVVSSAGQLNIGNFFSIPVTAGMLVPPLGPDGLMVEPGQAITLNQASAGQIGLWCMGQEMASEGLRW